jgi:transcriptional regulator with XRE-family HTH domain
VVSIFGFDMKNKTVKELRKNQGLTARELAQILKVDPIDILRIEEVKVRDLPDHLKNKILPILRGDYMDKIPWA